MCSSSSTMAVQLIRTPSLWGELREGEMSKRKGRHRLSAGLIKINQDGGGGGHVLVIHFRCRSNQPTSLKRSVKTRDESIKNLFLFFWQINTRESRWSRHDRSCPAHKSRRGRFGGTVGPAQRERSRWIAGAPAKTNDDHPSHRWRGDIHRLFCVSN